MVKLKTTVAPYGTIKKLQDEKPYLQLVTDSQDVQEIWSTLGGWSKVFDGFFVCVDDGEYKEVFGFEGSVPTLGKQVWRLEQVIVTKGTAKSVKKAAKPTKRTGKTNTGISKAR